MNNETENWKLKKIDVRINCVSESPILIFFSEGAMPQSPPL